MARGAPDVQLECLTTARGNVLAVRDDLLEGGTKQRAAVPFVRKMMKKGINEFVYASPANGQAQVALARACHLAGARCIIFAEHFDGCLSLFSARAARYATVHLKDSLEEAKQAADNTLFQTGTSLTVPLGFAHPQFHRHLLAVLAVQWRVICGVLRCTPQRIWVPVGSGTLAIAMRAVLPTSTKLICVDVHVLDPSDSRIEKVRQLKNTEYISAVQPFKEPAHFIPPIPSNAYYDAKLWQLISERCCNGDLWWNVAA